MGDTINSKFKKAEICWDTEKMLVQFGAQGQCVTRLRLAWDGVFDVIRNTRIAIGQNYTPVWRKR